MVCRYIYQTERFEILGAFRSTKFPFEMSEIPRAQWNGTFRLHRPDPIHRAFGYCCCKQDTKERYWGQQFWQMERDQIGRRGLPSKLIPNIPVGPNPNGPFHLMYQPKCPEFWVEWKAPNDSRLIG